jgi:hypothetical protein
VGVTGTRTEIRGMITRTITVGPSSAAPCALSATLETYDTSTGVTHVYVPNIAISGVSVGPVIPLGGR